MTDEFGFEQKRREERRWMILRVLNAGRPIGASEDMIGLCLRDTSQVCGKDELRKDLDYLRSLKLIEIDDGVEELGWYGTLLAEGVGVVEYSKPCPAGIARPPKRSR